jgi:hypothetical protein
MYKFLRGAALAMACFILAVQSWGQTRTQEELMEAAHPGWVKLVQTKQFTDWLAQQPPFIQKLAKSEMASDSIGLLNFFKNDMQTIALLAPVKREVPPAPLPENSGDALWRLLGAGLDAYFEGKAQGYRAAAEAEQKAPGKPQNNVQQGVRRFSPSGYQTRDSLGNLVNSNDSYVTRDSQGNLVNSRDSFVTRDSFGNLVDSRGCFQTKDSFGNLVMSAGC